MPETTYTYARTHFDELCDQTVRDSEPIILKREGAPDIALIAAAELSSLQETLHLLASPANAQRLFRSLARAERGDGTPQSVNDLHRETGLPEPPTA